MNDLNDPAVIRAIHKALIHDIPERILVLHLPGQQEASACWVEGAQMGALLHRIEGLVQRSEDDHTK